MQRMCLGADEDHGGVHVFGWRFHRRESWSLEADAALPFPRRQGTSHLVPASHCRLQVHTPLLLAQYVLEHRWAADASMYPIGCLRPEHLTCPITAIRTTTGSEYLQTPSKLQAWIRCKTQPNWNKARWHWILQQAAVQSMLGVQAGGGDSESGHGAGRQGSHGDHDGAELEGGAAARGGGPRAGPLPRCRRQLRPHLRRRAHHPHQDPAPVQVRSPPSPGFRA